MPSLTLHFARALVFLNSTIVPSEYCFAHYVIPPVQTPLRNILSLTLKDHDGTIKDAAVDLPGRPIWDKLKIRAKQLVWDVLQKTTFHISWHSVFVGVSFCVF